MRHAMRNGLAISAGIGLALATGLALAADGKAAPKADRLARMLERHPEADTDGDGVLTVEEAKAFFADNPGLGPRGPKGKWGGGPGGGSDG